MRRANTHIAQIRLQSLLSAPVEDRGGTCKLFRKMIRSYPARRGRRPWTDRQVVEDCSVLDLRSLREEGLFIRLHGTPFTLTWINTEGTVVCWLVEGIERKLKLVHHRDSHTERQTVDLDVTACRFGGQRFWWFCPGLNGTPCGRRCTNLYCPPEQKKFACRRCHNLT